MTTLPEDEGAVEMSIGDLLRSGAVVELAAPETFEVRRGSDKIDNARTNMTIVTCTSKALKCFDLCVVKSVTVRADKHAGCISSYP
jgi:hypothetical protein